MKDICFQTNRVIAMYEVYYRISYRDIITDEPARTNDILSLRKEVVGLSLQ